MAIPESKFEIIVDKMFGNVGKIVISSQFIFQENLTVYSFNIANLFKNIPHLLEGIKGKDKK